MCQLIWLEAAAIDRLAAMRSPGESYSDVILRLVEVEAKGSSG
jgi:predicted CopG family antitoxin